MKVTIAISQTHAAAIRRSDFQGELPEGVNSLEERVEFLVAEYCDATLLQEAEAEMHRWRALREKMENNR